MKFGRWLIMAVLASFAAILMVSSVTGQGLRGANSAVIFDYEVTNDGGILFADEFDRLGGVDTLGYPASYRFELDGFTYQVTQRALLQWRSNIGVAYLGNIFEMLEHAGLDQWLLESKGIPLPIKDDGSNGDWNKARETRLSWLTNEQIKAKFLANPNPNAISDWNEDSAINLYGLPMSMPEKHGPFISQRFQRVAFQLWVDEVAGSPAPGTVIGVLAGDLLKEAGRVPAEGLNVAERPVVVAPAPAPAPASAPSQSQPTATAEPTPPPADLTLSALSLGDVVLSSEFDADTTTYTANADNEVESVTVTATAASSDATVVIKLNGTADDDGTVDLTDGDGNVITIEVTVGDDTATYTVTVTRAIVEGARLSSLSLSDGATLSPTFDGGTFEYTASVVNSVANTTVSYTKSDEATVAITPSADADPSTDGHQVTLGAGVTTITLNVTVGDVTNTYKVDVTKGLAAADDTLSALTLTADSIALDPTFSKHTTSYSMTVANKVLSTTVTATATEATASVEVKVGDSVSNTVSLPAGETTTINVEVTSGDQTASRTYKIEIYRMSTSGPGDSTLASLSLSGITLAFSPAVTSYTATVPYGTGAGVSTEVTFEPNAAGATATLAENGVGAHTSPRTVALAVGETIITVTVDPSSATAPSRDYRITVTRQARTKGANADLAALSLSGITLSPVFDANNPDVTSYTANVPNSLLTTTVTADVADTASSDPDNTGSNTGVATREIKKGEDTGGTVGLDPGDNVITVVVTAEDGTTTKTYTITVTKRSTTGDDDATLFALSVVDNQTTPMNVVLNPSFDYSVTSYTAAIPFAATDVTVTATTNSADASAATAGNTGLVVGSTDVTVTVTAKDPNTTKVYTIAVTRAAEVTNDATLTGLSIANSADSAPIALVETFASGTYLYTATVANSVTAVDVTATLSDSGATAVVKDGDGTVDADGNDIALSDGANPITVEVTARDGTTKLTYTVTVTRTPLGTDATLSALSLTTGTVNVDLVNVTLDPTFASGTFSYTATVTASPVNVLGTASGSNATVAYTLNNSATGVTSVSDGSADIALNLGTGTISVTVTAEDGTTTQAYNIQITRN